MVREDPEQPGAYYLHEAYDEAALVCQTPCQSLDGDERETLVAGLGVLATGVTRAAPPADPSLPVPPDAPPAALVVLLSTAGLLSCYALADDERPASRVAAAPLPAPAAAAAKPSSNYPPMPTKAPSKLPFGAPAPAPAAAKASGYPPMPTKAPSKLPFGSPAKAPAPAAKPATFGFGSPAAAPAAAPTFSFGGAAAAKPSFSFAAPAPAPAAAAKSSYPPMPTKAPSKLPFGAPAPAAARSRATRRCPRKRRANCPLGRRRPPPRQNRATRRCPQKLPASYPLDLRRRPPRSRPRATRRCPRRLRASFRSARRRPRRPRKPATFGFGSPAAAPAPAAAKSSYPPMPTKAPSKLPFGAPAPAPVAKPAGFGSPAPAAPTTQEELPEGWSLQVPKDAEEAEKWRVCLEMEQAMAKMRQRITDRQSSHRAAIEERPGGFEERKKVVGRSADDGPRLGGAGARVRRGWGRIARFRRDRAAPERGNAGQPRHRRGHDGRLHR